MPPQATQIIVSDLRATVLQGDEKCQGARKIIIDTDPGQDDAAAIMLALGSPEEIEVLGITALPAMSR